MRWRGSWPRVRSSPGCSVAPATPAPPASGPAESAERFELRTVYPSKEESRRLRGRIFGQIYRNRGFFLVTAAAYALVAMAVPADRIFDAAGWLQTVAALLPVTLVGLFVFAALYVFAVGTGCSRMVSIVVVAIPSSLARYFRLRR